MGTNNFASPKNASKYFVVGANREEKYSECECGKHYEWEDEYVGEVFSTCPICKSDVEHEEESRPLESWEWDELEENLRDILSELEGFEDINRKDHSRNYADTFLGSVSKSKSWGDAEFTVSILPVMTSAYYEGATLDFKIEITTVNDTYDYNEESIGDILFNGFDDYYIYLNRGLASIFKKYAEVWIEETVTELSEEVEKVFETVSSHKLKNLGSFSNGEAVYESVN